MVITTGCCLEEVSTKVTSNVTSNDRLENAVIDTLISHATTHDPHIEVNETNFLNDTLVAKSEHVEQLNSTVSSINLLNDTSNIVTKPVVSKNETLIFNDKENKTEVNALEKPPGMSSSNGDLLVTSESITVPGDLVTSDDLEVTTFNDLEDEDYTFRDGSNETVPWWRRRPYPLRQRARPCECKNYRCGCCAGMDIQRLNISQNGSSTMFTLLL